MDLEKLAREFEENQQPKANIEVVKSNIATKSAMNVVDDVQQEILRRAKQKINSESILEKHANKITKITDEAMRVDAERASLNVKEQDAANKAEKQEIKNKLIVLKAEAKRLKKEQRQLNLDQKAEHKARSKQAKWDLYKDKLKKMKYDYVPNRFILSMLLFFDGVKSFFDGIGAVSTAFLKAMKWILLLGAILIVLFAIPVTREWILEILRGGI